ncbi:hypothetical protein ABPG74_011790 [Tetrahymena malaccensis]
MKSIYDDPITIKTVVYTAENILKIVFPYFCFIQRDLYADILVYLICILVIIRQLKPTFTSQFFALLIYNEYFQNIVFTIPYYFFGQKGIIYYSIFAIHFSVGIADYIYLSQKAPYKLFKNVTDYIRSNKQQIMLLKNFVEVLLLVVEIVFVVTDIRQLIIVVFYCNFLRIKYYFNENLLKVISLIDTFFQDNFEKPDSPRILRYFLKFVRMIVHRLRIKY